MNILVVFPGKSGGGTVFALDIAKGFAENGHRVCAIIAKGASNEKEWTDVLGEENVYRFTLHHGAGDFIKKCITLPLGEGRRIKEKFADIRFDFVLKTMYYIWTDMLVKYVNADRVVSICHDPLPHSGEKKYCAYLSKKFTQRSDDVFVLTKRFIPIVEKRCKLPKEKIHYVPHGRLHNYNKTDKRLVNFRETDTNFVFFGRIQEYKGIKVLLEAYKKVHDKHKNTTLTIAGKGDFSAYEKLAADCGNITVINRFIDDDEVGGLFDGANTVLVLPYLDATQSGVILIAYEYGVPIIASNCGGLSEQLDDGRLGMLCEPGNVEELSECMLHFIGNPSAFEEQKIKMKEYLRKLDWDIIAKSMCDGLGY